MHTCLLSKGGTGVTSHRNTAGTVKHAGIPPTGCWAIQITDLQQARQQWAPATHSWLPPLESWANSAPVIAWQLWLKGPDNAHGLQE